MLEFLFGKKDNSVAIDKKINEIYSSLKKLIHLRIFQMKEKLN